MESQAPGEADFISLEKELLRESQQQSACDHCKDTLLIVKLILKEVTEARETDKVNFQDIIN